ncbi:NADP-binding protein [Gigaspora margarita]|uniref:NADP-binding protein n=1 Tax=Gigaspora margarita TaxID=4874 RepID=A0A8H4APV7_GIGMA|nr:NADP-binding protein [Gigaspora margarita]
MSSQKPLVVVSGATGAQGGSVVNSLLATGKYRVRALTRNLESDKAKTLATKGAEVYKCDLSIKEDVKNALNGSDIAFINTNTWDPATYPNNPTEEERQGKMIADVAKEIGLNWLIYSSLPETLEGFEGSNYNIIAFYGKNRVEKYIRALGIPNATFIYIGFYASNIGTIYPIITKNDGTSEFVIPVVKEDTTIEIVDVETDTGPVVAKVIEEGPEKWNGKKVPVASEYISFGKIAETMTKVTGRQVKLRSLNPEETKKELPSMERSLDMYRWFNEYGVFRSEISDISVAKVLHPNITTFEQYAYKTWGNK